MSKAFVSLNQMGELIRYIAANTALHGRSDAGDFVDVHYIRLEVFSGDAEELRKLIEATGGKGEFCDANLLDGNEHGYMEIGGWIGDQTLALALMGLGAKLGLWRLITPKDILKLAGLEGDKEMADAMAGRGLVTIKAQEVNN